MYVTANISAIGECESRLGSFTRSRAHQHLPSNHDDTSRAVRRARHGHGRRFDGWATGSSVVED
jgi:hypothetical protein